VAAAGRAARRGRSLELAVTARYLPPGARCSAYWYAQRGGMLPYGVTDPDDLEFLRVLGARAVLLARWYGYLPWQVPEGPYLVHMWPEHVWDEVASAMANEAAERGTWEQPGPGYWAAGDYG
jgi:hypothetical protein